MTNVAKVDLEFMLNQVRIELPGASDAALKLQLFDVLKEFFNDTSAWQESLSVDVTPDSTSYWITPSQGGKIIRLVNAFDVNNIPQPALLGSDFDTIDFKYAYNMVQTLTVVVVKNVKQPTGKELVPEFPDWVLSVHGLYIKHGLLGHMMAQQGKTYTNDSLSVFHMKKFRDGIAMVRTAVLRRNTFGSQAWVFPQSFSTRSQRRGIAAGPDRRF